MLAPLSFVKNVGDSFCVGQAHYGDIEVSLDLFISYVWDIACKRINTLQDERILVDFTKGLYLRDLYLACGCVQNSDKAWTTFDSRFRPFITDLVRFCYRRGTDTEEEADSVVVSLYFHDRSGRQRIASYDGRSSLATWLRVIVLNRSINQHINTSRTVGDESMPDIADFRPLANLEATLRAERYGKALANSLTQALYRITGKERLMLLWRYEDNLQLGEIAELLGIHQSNVTRQLVRIQTRLREAVIETLASEYHLSSSAIQECLADVIDNPQISVCLLNSIKRASWPVAAAPGARDMNPADEH